MLCSHDLQAGCRKKKDGSCTSPYSVVNWASLTAKTVDDDSTVSKLMNLFK